MPTFGDNITRAFIILLLIIVLLISTADIALSQYFSLGVDLFSLGGSVDLENHVSGFSDRAQLQKGNLSYGGTIVYSNYFRTDYAKSIEFLAPNVLMKKNTSEESNPSNYSTHFDGSTQLLKSEIQMEDASGGSYGMTIDSPSRARQTVRISDLSIFNASNIASENFGGTDITLQMSGIGDYRSKAQVLGGLKNQPIGESDMKVKGSAFEINSTLRYLL